MKVAKQRQKLPLEIFFSKILYFFANLHLKTEYFVILVVISVTLETCIHKIKTETKGKLDNKIY